MGLEQSQLGKKSAYIDHYAPELLIPIPRKLKRDEIGVDDNHLPFYGADIWNHYEVSWLNNHGKPQVALAVITLPVTSPNIIESKSMKLYFNSFNNYKLASQAQFREILIRDLSQAAGQAVNVELVGLDQTITISPPSGKCLDELEVSLDEYIVKPENLLTIAKEVHECLYSNLLKANCLVTGQPDWATIFVEYRGNKIDHSELLKYFISFRNHKEFHEQCVERIFTHLLRYCQPQELTVMARFTRRGGLDINPLRSTQQNFTLTNQRLIRQ